VLDGRRSVRARVVDAVNSAAAGAGTFADRVAGDAFEAEVARVCGLAGNWLQMRYEGPDMFALGAYDGDVDWRWETCTDQDTWAARLNVTTAGQPAAWTVPCDSVGEIAALGVVDEDIAFDDDVGLVGLQLSTIPDQAICDGWGFYPGNDGIAGVLVRLDVVGARPSCP